MVYYEKKLGRVRFGFRRIKAKRFRISYSAVDICADEEPWKTQSRWYEFCVWRLAAFVDVDLKQPSEELELANSWSWP